MKLRIAFFYRHPEKSYFSIEKIFQQITWVIEQLYPNEFEIESHSLPFTSKLNTVYPNILFARDKQQAINHITGDIHYALLGFKKKHINILTIHDCVPLHRYKNKKLKFWVIKWLWFDLPIRKADVVTVISENTKSDLLQFVKCDPEKIRVIGNFVDPFFQYADFVFNAERPRVLFVGTNPNKNLDRLVMALEGLPVLLDIVGKLNAHQKELLATHHIQYEQSEGLSKIHLIKKYRACDMVAFPSTFEGFGLPIVEAQATGRPVLTSNISPMCEVAGEGACLIDPFDIASIRSGIIKIIDDKSYRESIIQKGLENIKRFFIEEVTGKYVELYKEMAKKKEGSSNVNGRSDTDLNI